MVDLPQRELFEHGADVGVRGYGDTLGAAFANAAVALTSVITDPALVRSTSSVDTRVSAPDVEVLLVRWLNEVVYEMATRRMLFGSYDVTVEQASHGWRLTARMSGEPVESLRHQPAVEVKGATYTGLEVGRGGGRWHAQCVVDV